MRTRLRQTTSRPTRKAADSKIPTASLASVESIIHTIRSERVILDADLARLYGVPTKVFNQAVRRNRYKFPADFLLELTSVEAELLRRSRSQIVTLKRGQNIKFSPFAFTGHGAIMAANILNSPQAIQMSVFVRIAARRAPAPEPLRVAPGPRLAA